MSALSGNAKFADSNDNMPQGVYARGAPDGTGSSREERRELWKNIAALCANYRLADARQLWAGASFMLAQWRTLPLRSICFMFACMEMNQIIQANSE